MFETMTTCLYHFMSVLDRIKHPSLKEHKNYANVARAEGHMISLIKDYIVEPVVISSHNARQSPIYDKTITVLSDIFTSYYIQAFRILCDHYGLDIVSTVNILTSDKGGEFRAFAKSGMGLIGDIGSVGTAKYDLTTEKLKTTRYLSNDYYSSLMGDGMFLRVSSEAKGKGRDNTNPNGSPKPKNYTRNQYVNQTYNISAPPELLKQMDNKDSDEKKEKLKKEDIYRNDYEDKELEEITKRLSGMTEHMDELFQNIEDLGGSPQLLDYIKRHHLDQDHPYSKYVKKGRTGKITSLAEMEKNPLYKIHTRNIEIDINYGDRDKNKVIIPITIKTVVLAVDTGDIHNLIEHGNASKGFKDRLFDLVNGNLKFKDFIFASDMIEQYKKNKIKDKEGLVKLVRQRNTYRNLTDNTTAKGFDANYNLLLLTTEDVEKYEPILGGKITKENVKEKLLNDTRSLAGVILDDDYERATIITSKIRGFNNVGYGLLKTRDESKGYEDILKSLLNNKPMSF